MTFDEILDQAIEILQRRGRVTYRTLKVQFDLNDDLLDVLKEELIYGQRLAEDEDDRVLVWIGESGESPKPTSISAPASEPEREPLSYTPPHLAEKILHSKKSAWKLMHRLRSCSNCSV